MVFEVPHANDILLSESIECPEFKRFTLWSQHLILHTRASLQGLLHYCGFENIIVEGVQRYPLSNHLHWLAKGQPGGHRSSISTLDTSELQTAYESALRKIDATDTLVAVCQVP